MPISASNSEYNINKEKILKLFFDKVKGKKPNTSASNLRHDGKEGHWLETQMNVKHNSKNETDLFGFEMKNHTKFKTTFGDWSPASALYKKGTRKRMTRTAFLVAFGSPNPEKNNRYSWSGKPCPKIGCYNRFGQILKVDARGNITAEYSFSRDERPHKASVVPKDLQINDLILAEWPADFMKTKVERKFNKLGWFKCVQNSTGAYENIVFGKPINFDTWIDGVRKRQIYFDSGMYEGNARPYAQWRANNDYWESLVVERH